MPTWEDTAMLNQETTGTSVSTWYTSLWLHHSFRVSPHLRRGSRKLLPRSSLPLCISRNCLQGSLPLRHRNALQRDDNHLAGKEPWDAQKHRAMKLDDRDISTLSLLIGCNPIGAPSSYSPGQCTGHIFDGCSQL